jgi:hypothetical protein
MAFYDLVWYCNAGDQSTTGHYAVAKRPQNAAVTAGQLVRQFTAPAVGSERVFVCIIAGTTANVTDATWVLTRGAKTTDGTATWMEVTGMSAVNGDLTNTPTWAAAKAISSAVTLGAIIQRNTGASYWICSTAGSTGASEPAWTNNTAGTTQADSTVTWTCLGVVGNFTGGQAPHARINNALANTWFLTGNTVFVGDNHAESYSANLSLNASGTLAAISRIVCHDHAGPYPPASGNLMSGASFTTTNSGGTISFIASGSFYFYGIAFKAGAASGGSPTIVLGGFTLSGWLYFDNCSMQLAETSGAGAGVIALGSNNSATTYTITFNNTTVKFGAAGDAIIATLCRFIWQNTGPILVSGSVVPTNLITTNASSTSIMSDYVLEALDLSQITTSLYSNAPKASNCNVSIKDCKLNAAVTVATPILSGSGVQMVRSDSGATDYKSARYAYEGTETTETAITRVGGASDPTGQAQSRKIVTTANSQWLRPFKAEPYAIWNPTTGANVTVTVCGTINAGALPNNDDIWMEVEYLGSASFPVGTIVSTTKSNLLAANAAVASDGSTWNGGGSGAGWSPFKLVATLSSPQPGMAGYLHVRVRAAKPSTTLYIDPQITLS